MAAAEREETGNAVTVEDRAGEAAEFYAAALRTLNGSGVPFMVGGAYSLAEYAGIVRDTKDLDIFCKASDYPVLLRSLGDSGYDTEVTDASWLAKAFSGDYFVDLIFNSGNGLCPVDDTWFEQATEVTLFGCNALLVPAEEIIWSKSTVQDRFRFDGADVLHIIRARGKALNWKRLLQRMEPVWEILLAHLVTFRFVYPSEREMVPDWVMEDLLGRVHDQLRVPASHDRICRGGVLSRTQYQIDIEAWGYTPK